MKVFPRPPLRSPGQSVQREMDRLLEDRMLPILLFATLMGFMAVYDWTVVLLQYTPWPGVSTTLALLGAGYAGYKYGEVGRP